MNELWHAGHLQCQYCVSVFHNKSDIVFESGAGGQLREVATGNAFQYDVYNGNTVLNEQRYQEIAQVVFFDARRWRVVSRSDLILYRHLNRLSSKACVHSFLLGLEIGVS